MLREAILSCVTPDRSRLELLDAYVPWIKSGFVKEPPHERVAIKVKKPWKTVEEYRKHSLCREIRPCYDRGGLMAAEIHRKIRMCPDGL